MIDKNNKEYWKCQPCKVGDTVEVFEDYLEYAAKTIYKVHYAELAKGRILVEVDPKKNFIDSEYIKGWDYSSRSISEEKLYELKKDKLYWWIYYWNLIKESKFLKNE